MALDTVLSDLERQSYETRAVVLPACAIDAPHRRDRVCIVGRVREKSNILYSDTEGEQHTNIRKREEEKQKQSWDGGLREIFSNSESVRLQRERATWEQERRARPAKGESEGRGHVFDASSAGLPNRSRKTVGESEQEQEPKRPSCAGGLRSVEPGMGGGLDGLSAWMDGVRTGWADGTWEAGIPRIAVGVPDRTNRLKCLGNAVVPAQFYTIFSAIAKIEMGAKA